MASPGLNGLSKTNGVPHTDFPDSEIMQDCRVVVIAEQMKRLDTGHLRQLRGMLERILGDEESKTAGVVRNIFSPRTGKEFSEQRTKEFQEAVKSADGAKVKKMLAEGKIDINREMSVEPNLLEREVNKKAASSLSLGISPPVAASPRPKSSGLESPIKVPPIYYALEQFLLSTNTLPQQTAFHFIFLDLLKNLEIDLSQRKQTPYVDECGGFSILHLAVAKGNKAIVKTILETHRVDVEQEVEHVHESAKYNGYTPLDLAVAMGDKASDGVKLNHFVEIYKLLESSGAKHKKKQKPDYVKSNLQPNEAREFVRRLSIRGQSRPGLASHSETEIGGPSVPRRGRWQ